MSLHGPLGATQGGAFELTTSSLDARTVVRSRAGLLALATLLASGLVVTVAAADTDALLPESVRPVPSWLAGPFGSSGIDIHVAGTLLCLALMFTAYVIVVRVSDRIGSRAVLAGIAAVHALVLLAPPLISTDVFSYQAYARIGALYGANPYLHGPHAIALDPLYPFIGAKWVNMPSVYGPLFTIFSYILAPVSIAASILAYKAMAALASLVTVALIWNAARLRGVSPVRAAALFGLNPLIVVYGVGGGHNDLVMVAVMMAGVYLLLARRERSGAASLVIAIGVKLSAGLMLPFALAGSGRPLSGSRRREIAIGAGFCAALVAGLSFAAFGSGLLRLIATVHQSQSEGDWHSLPGFIGTRLGLGTVGQVTGYVLALLSVGIVGWLVRRVWRGELDWIVGAGWATLAVLACAGSLMPWYVAWLIPLAAIGRDRRLLQATLWLAGCLQFVELLGHIPHGGTLGL
ncbi:MAG: polyprenol phosphomannose-dependent alpha 1,6 mannosyltransferase MptB [Solirubrobacterales bacterium]|nr:polyprenol phosphomannose-dependent alpha 1,6 mannosyltransferase MptB [Solirubrobacterales bacterium]